MFGFREKPFLVVNKWGLRIVDLALNPNQTLQTDSLANHQLRLVSETATKGTNLQP